MNADKNQRERRREKGEFYKSDEDAKYHKVIEYDASKIEPQVSAPHLPSNSGPVSKFKKVNIG